MPGGSWILFFGEQNNTPSHFHGAGWEMTIVTTPALATTTNPPQLITSTNVPLALPTPAK